MIKLLLMIVYELLAITMVSVQGVVPQSDLSSTIIVSRCYNDLSSTIIVSRCYNDLFLRLTVCSMKIPYLKLTLGKKKVTITSTVGTVNLTYEDKMATFVILLHKTEFIFST